MTAVAVIVAVVLRARHERYEAVRDRMVQAADDFGMSVSEAHGILSSGGEEIHEEGVLGTHTAERAMAAIRIVRTQTGRIGLLFDAGSTAAIAADAIASVAFQTVYAGERGDSGKYSDLYKRGGSLHDVFMRSAMELVNDPGKVDKLRAHQDFDSFDAKLRQGVGLRSSPETNAQVCAAPTADLRAQSRTASRSPGSQRRAARTAPTRRASGCAPPHDRRCRTSRRCRSPR